MHVKYMLCQKYGGAAEETVREFNSPLFPPQRCKISVMNLCSDKERFRLRVSLLHIRPARPKNRFKTFPDLRQVMKASNLYLLAQFNECDSYFADLDLQFVPPD